MKPNSEKKSKGRQTHTPSGPEPVVSHRWTFLTNHSHVLISLRSNPDIVLREVAVQVGITERAVQRIIQELEEEGYILRRKVGRKNQYEVLIDQPLRHLLEWHCSIGDLLGLIESKSTPAINKRGRT